MARTINPLAYAAKRETILDAVEGLIASKGYDSLTILDVLAVTRMSKGAFYHYFSTKSDVLGALLERRLDRWQALIEPIADSDMTATERLRGILQALGNAKLDDRAFLADSLRSLYSDENALVHRRTREGARARFAPVLARIVGDGVATGEFHAESAEGAAQVVVSLVQECAESIGRILLALSIGQADLRTLVSTTQAYVRAIHAALGAADGALDFVTDAQLKSWASAVEKKSQRAAS